jgi:hypothetical protein
MSDLAKRIESPVSLEKSEADFGCLSKYLFLVKNSSSARSGVLTMSTTVVPKTMPTIGGTSFLPLKYVSSMNSMKGCPFVLSF